MTEPELTNRGKSPVGTTGIHDRPATGGAARPSLLKAGAVPQGHNILDTVSPRTGGTTPKASPSRLVWLLLPLAAALTWTWFNRQALAPEPPAQQVAVAKPVPAPAPQPAPPPVTPPPPEKDPAVSPVVPRPVGQDPFSALASTDTAPAAVPSETPVTAAVASAPVARTTRTTKVSEASKPQAKKPTATPPTPAKVVAVQKPVSSGTPPRTAAAAQPATGKQDPDVELLNAIMKHLNDGGGKAVPTRSPQTIADLVQSCQSRDAIETLLCQRRICEGSWGKAQACPVDRAPKSAVSAR